MVTSSTRVGACRTSRMAIVATITLVFLTGAFAGAVVNHRFLHRSSVPFWTEGGKEIWLQRWKKDLDLTPEQAQEMTLILDDFGTYYRNVLSDGKARILRVLNEDQRKKFDRMLEQQQK
jgi:hypothetical protein